MKITFSNKYVAFIDVLGFTDMVFSNTKEKLEKYFEIVDMAFEIFNDDKKTLNKLAISDSIILIAEDNAESFVSLLKAIRTLQTYLARRDIWVRGGISVGEVHFDHKSNTVVGKGFINAYLLEKEAIYPRVMIDPQILGKQALTRREFYKNLNKEPHERKDGKLIHDYGVGGHVRYTNDDSIFVCYANKLLSRSLYEERNRNPDQTSDIELVYEFLQKNLYGSQKHYSKYLWLKKYFQEVLHEFISNSAGDDSDDKRFVNEMLVKYMNL